MICEAVFNGQISESHLSQAEIDEFMELVLDASTDKLMAEAEARGCSVYGGIEGNTVQ
jgi:hypothetical protein